MVNYHQTNEFKTIGCYYNGADYYKNYRVLYFNETKEFMFVSSKVLATTILNSFNASVGICNKKILIIFIILIFIFDIIYRIIISIILFLF